MGLTMAGHPAKGGGS